MDRLSLKAFDREILGKKVKNLRHEGFVPAHVFGKGTQTENVSVKLSDFSKTYQQAGESGLIDLKIGEEKIRPVLIRDVQVDPLRGDFLHVDFYQVNLKEKVTVTVPVVLTGEESELVHTGEAVVIQPMSEVEVEALPTDLPEKIEVDITPLTAIDDAITISQLVVPEGVVILADPEAVVAKLDSAVTEEMQKLLEEQQQEAEAAAVAQAAEAGEEPVAETAVEGEAPSEGEAPVEGGEKPSEEKPQE